MCSERVGDGNGVAENKKFGKGNTFHKYYLIYFFKFSYYNR